MAADLRLVADAAKRHAHELAVQRTCDRLADRRLARSGRADQRQDRTRFSCRSECRAPGGACAPRGTRRCGPSRPRARRDRRRAPPVRSAGRECSSDRFDHGTAVSQSRYVRIIDASPEESPIVSRRRSSRSAWARTASGIPASSIFVRYSSTTEPSSSPSSLRIDSICLRRTYSRLLLLDVGVDVLADAAGAPAARRDARAAMRARTPASR